MSDRKRCQPVPKHNPPRFEDLAVGHDILVAAVVMQIAFIPGSHDLEEAARARVLRKWRLLGQSGQRDESSTFGVAPTAALRRSIIKAGTLLGSSADRTRRARDPGQAGPLVTRGQC